MLVDRDHFVERLKHHGWDVRILEEALPIPADVKQRFPWLAPDVQSFLENIERAVSPDAKAWFVSTREMIGQSDSAFSWDEWERQSLYAAGADEALRARIREFWDSHFPVMLSVKSDYAYFAIEKDTLRVVHGEEPEYEETSVIADSFSEFLESVASGAEKLRAWL